MNNKWDNIISEILSSDNIVIFSHDNMDGDAIGSAMALCASLRQINKNAVILTYEGIPAYLSFLCKKHSDYFTSVVPFSLYTAVAVDCSDRGRLSERAEAFDRAEKKLCIDHHKHNGDFADCSLIEPESSAAGILVFELLQELKIVLDSEIAGYIYVAISSDTGSFKFSNTDAYTHLVAAQLYSYGIDAASLCNNLYDVKPLKQLKLEALAINHLETVENGLAVISYVRKAEYEALGAEYEQLDTCIDCIRLTEGTEIACMIKEKDDGMLKVSLRSKNYADVCSLAEKFGGGGHLRAAGCNLYCSIDEAKNILKKVIKEAL